MRKRETCELSWDDLTPAFRALVRERLEGQLDVLKVSGRFRVADDLCDGRGPKLLKSESHPVLGSSVTRVKEAELHRLLTGVVVEQFGAGAEIMEPLWTQEGVVVTVRLPEETT